MSLDGRTILITGAGRRIGCYLAKRCSESGANVILHTSGAGKGAEELAARLRSQGRQAWVLKADFSNPKKAARVMDQAWNLAPVDGLVNNAAIFEPLSWHNTSLENWQRHMDINQTAPFLLSQAFARRVSDQGVIVNILDWRALRPGADHLPYTISKAGLAALTRSLAAALAPRVRVNGVALGAILPPSDGSEVGDVDRLVPAKRWAQLEEVWSVVEFLLAGPEIITGQVLHLDGGRHLV